MSKGKANPLKTVSKGAPITVVGGEFVAGQWVLKVETTGDGKYPHGFSDSDITDVVSGNIVLEGTIRIMIAGEDISQGDNLEIKSGKVIPHKGGTSKSIGVALQSVTFDPLSPTTVNVFVTPPG